MSKITLTPNASGTGTFTVASPNSNTNRTLTLPDEAGELLINGTTSNVGIGTSSPSNRVSLKTTNGGCWLQTEDSVNTSGGNVNLFGSFGTGTAAIYTTGANPIGFYTNATERMRIDSSGNVGIGTSSPGISGGYTSLALNNSTNSGWIQLMSGGTSVADWYSSGGTENTLRSLSGGFTFTVSGASDFKFDINSSERMRIDSSGNVGIGTSSPTHRLDILNDGGEQLRILAWDQSASARANIDFWYLDAGGSPYNNAQISTLAAANAGNGNLVFSTRPTSGSLTERMRIDSSGKVLCGLTGVIAGNRPETLQASGVSGSHAAFATFMNSTGAETQVTFHNPNGKVGQIDTNGSSTSYITSSDHRLKTDAQPMTGASARVQALNPVNFKWIADGTRVDGFLAHEAQEVVPEAVTGTKDAMRDEEYEVTPAVYEDVVIPAVLDDEGNELEAERTEQQLVTEAVMGTRSVPDYQGIDQSKLVPLLTAALQEALTEISDLKARVVALEAV